MKILGTIGVLLLLTSSVVASGKGKKMIQPWPLKGPYRSVQIIEYKSLSDRTHVKSVVIGSEETIKKLIAQIEKVPSKGDIMVKPSPDSAYVKVLFTKTDGYDRNSVEILNDRIKTPSTGFNSKTGAAEKEALATIRKLLANTGVWFPKDAYDSLRIVKRRSAADNEIEKAIRTTDANFIKSLIARIGELPADGQKMKSVAPTAAHAALEFSSGNDVHTIELYDGKLKTPSTGFNSNPSEAELEIGKGIEALLAPELWKATPKVKDLELKLKEMAVVYKGTSETPQGPKGPSVGPTYQDTFEIRDPKGKLQTLKTMAGQNPYPPVDFKIDRERYVLDVRTDWFLIQPFRGE